MFYGIILLISTKIKQYKDVNFLCIRAKGRYSKVASLNLVR